jgi:hypothetical protein
MGRGRPEILFLLDSQGRICVMKSLEFSAELKQILIFWKD